MAYLKQDPYEAIIADGRARILPVQHYEVPDVITINLEVLHQILVSKLSAVLIDELRLRNCYVGTSNEVSELVINDIKALVTYAVGVTYNRLRSILKATSPNALVARMKTRCPVPNGTLFPAWLSSALGSIGPCRVIDGPIDRLLVWASTEATMNNYGRDVMPDFQEGSYRRLISALQQCQIHLAPIDFAGSTGSFFPTIEPVPATGGMWSFYGTCHQSHYENEDVPKIALCTSVDGNTPFEKTGLTFGYVDDAATLTALTAVRPADIPRSETATSAGRPCGGVFRVNYFGIQPAVAATESATARDAGVYIIGRGTKRFYQCVLASNILYLETVWILRYRLMKSN